MSERQRANRPTTLGFELPDEVVELCSAAARLAEKELRPNVREFERERPARLTVVVDTAADTARTGDGPDETVLDRCCSVAASPLALAVFARATWSLACERRSSTSIVASPNSCASSCA